MSLSAIGNCQLLAQLYDYKGHRIACRIKVLPTPALVTHFKLKTGDDYHWMSAVRWARLEAALYRLLENLEHWQDAKKLRAELLVDYINVRVQATKEPYPETTRLLAGDDLAPEDLSLDIQLQFKTVKHFSIVRTEAEANDIAKSSSSSGRSPRAGAVSGGRPKAGIPEKLTRAKSKHIDADDQDDDDCPATSQSQQPTKSKRRRRSASQGGDIQDENSSTNGSSSRLGKRGFSSASGRNSLASFGESKAARRSKEKPSPVGNLKGKPTTPSPAEAVKEKSLKPTPAATLQGEQMDGAHLDALQRLDSMLAIPKPPEVQILLLENMSEADVLATFEGYRNDFDKLFKERKNKEYTHSYMNVGHMDVMDILNSDIRYKMIKKLAESYSTRSSHTSLVVNGLLPLWIVLLFTDKYKLSHGDAVRQIKDQLRWNSYLKAVNNDPLSSDLDD